MKKLFTAALALMLAILPLGCGNDGKKDESYLDTLPAITDASRPSWEQNDEEYNLTWFVDASWMIWPTYGADLVSRTIKEKTGCTIEFIIAGDDQSTELSTLLSSGDLADVMTIKASSIYASQLPSQDYVWSVDKLMNRFAPSMKPRYLEEQRDVYDWFKQDGELYGVPNLCYSDYYVGDSKLAPNGGFLVREDWYNEVVRETGEDMTTKDSFLRGVEYITDKYANAIGVQLDPFTSTGNLSAIWLSQYFAVPFEKEDGSYNYQLTDERYKEVIRFLNKLYTEKYIADANLTANTASVKRNVSLGNVFVCMATPQNYNDAFQNCYNNGITYVPLVLKNDAGDAPVLQDLRGKGYLLSMISKNCDRPDKVIQLFDYLTSEEGQLLINFGIEGDTFEWDEKREHVVWTQKYVDDYENESTAQYGFGLCNVLLNQSFYDKVSPVTAECKKDTSVYIENLKAPLSPYSYDYTASFLLPDTTRNDYYDFVEKEERVNQLWGRFLPQMISAKDEAAAIAVWENTISAMNNNGLSAVLAFRSDAYERAKNAAGVQYGWPPNNSDYVAPVTGANGDFSYWKYIEKTV